MSTDLILREDTLPIHVPRPCLYRYQEMRMGEGNLMLVLYEFPILKRTLCGTWIGCWSGRDGKRFVLDNSHKRYACPTKPAALESYHARKRRQVKILLAQLREAEAALQLQNVGEMSLVGIV